MSPPCQGGSKSSHTLKTVWQHCHGHGYALEREPGTMKRQEGNPLAGRLSAFGRSLSLTWQEQWMVAALLLSMLTGALVMHYRREYRAHHPVQASPTPRGSAGSTAGG